jgi:hypothetical protein
MKFVSGVITITLLFFFLFLASESTLSRWSRLHLQSLAPTNPHWARVVGYGPFFLCVIHKEGLCPSSGDINRLVMMMILLFYCEQQLCGAIVFW